MAEFLGCILTASPTLSPDKPKVPEVREKRKYRKRNTADNPANQVRVGYVTLLSGSSLKCRCLKHIVLSVKIHAFYTHVKKSYAVRFSMADPL